MKDSGQTAVPAASLAHFRRALTLLLLMLPSLEGLAAEHAGHQALAISETLTFSVIYEQALAHAPERLASEARAAEAQAWEETGTRWLAGRPTLELSYNNDRAMSNLGYREQETGLQLPLWRPGERRRAQQDGHTFQTQQSRWERYVAWQVAGQLRRAMADLDEALALLAVEQQATSEAAQLVALTQTLVDQGANPRLDLMQAEAQWLTQQERELQAEASVVDAERQYTLITSLHIRPAQPYTETPADQDAFTDKHPLLAWLHGDIAVSDAQLSQAEREARGSPSLTIGTRSEGGNTGQPVIDSVGIGVSVPLGGSRYAATTTSRARREKVEAEVRLEQQRRQLQWQLHEVEHRRFLNERSLHLAEQKQALSADTLFMARQAFALGEIPLQQVLNVQQQAQDDARHLARLRLQAQRLILDYHQILGVLP